MSLTDTILTGMENAPDGVDAFLVGSPHAAYQQSRAWAAVAPSAPRRGFRLWVAGEGGVPVAAVVVRRTMLSPGRWLATVQRGSIVHRVSDLRRVLPFLLADLGARGGCSVQLAPRVRGRDLPSVAEVLREAGFIPLPDDRQSLHRATGIVWLDKHEEDILAGFRQGLRRQLRAADKVASLSA